ncbi:MAG: CheR family methyltransferase [Pseudomonadota bacterium]|nr:CheR family methyltransferase [Pseudomonadota bacterium]
MQAAQERTATDRLRATVEQVTGIKLPAGKDLMIESRLRRRIHELGFDSFGQYLELLFKGGKLDEELPLIIDQLTTNKTDFHREKPHFDFFTEVIVPELAARRGGRVRVWSAASSSGEEAWTLAMYLADAAAAYPGLDWVILGTDISRRVLAIANRAVYRMASFAPLPQHMRARYVMEGRGDDAAGRIVPELRARVRFQRMNLTHIPYDVDRNLDVIFLRNVLIYFPPDLQARVIAAMTDHLRPGGYLFVGHSESMVVRHRTLRQCAPGVFQKVSD